MQKDYGVYMVGFVIDPQDHGSFVFGNGDEVKEYRQSQLFNLNQQVKDMEHSFGYVGRPLIESTRETDIYQSH
jgi:hypothetical protein